jgi:hypothetical protein
MRIPIKQIELERMFITGEQCIKYFTELYFLEDYVRSESWVACIFFVMNLIHYEANCFFGSFFRWIYVERDREEEGEVQNPLKKETQRR